MDFWENGGSEEGEKEGGEGFLVGCQKKELHFAVTSHPASQVAALHRWLVVIFVILFKSSRAAAVVEVSHTVAPAQSGCNKRIHTGDV